MSSEPIPAAGVAIASGLAAAPAPDAAGSTPSGPTSAQATTDAKRIAGAILEVLAGVRSITDAALALGVTSARYYALEARAVAGLIAACEPRGPGPLSGHGLASEIERLRGERDRLRDEAARYQALARIAQTAFGPSGAAVPSASGGGTALPGLTVRQQRAARAAARAAPAPAAAVKPRKKRVPTVRALRLAQQVQQHAASPTASPPGKPSSAAGG
jgi:hypothetical protein